MNLKHRSYAVTQTAKFMTLSSTNIRWIMTLICTIYIDLWLPWRSASGKFCLYQKVCSGQNHRGWGEQSHVSVVRVDQCGPNGVTMGHRREVKALFWTETNEILLQVRGPGVLGSPSSRILSREKKLSLHMILKK